MDEDDDDDGPTLINKIFSSFFRPSNDDFHTDNVFQDLHDLQKGMEAMFRDLEGLNFSVGFHPPSMSGSQVPPNRQTPRDMMLKDSSDEPAVDAKPQGSVPCEPCSRQGPTAEITTFQPAFNFTARWGNPDGHFFSSTTSRSTRFVRHPDDSTEKIEKVTENGHTCTTVTKSGVDGVTSTNTTCDRPAPDPLPSLAGPPSPVEYRGPPAPVDLPAAPTPRDPELGMSQDDTSFFNKLFGFKIFK